MSFVYFGESELIEVAAWLLVTRVSTAYKLEEIVFVFLILLKEVGTLEML